RPLGTPPLTWPFSSRARRVLWKRPHFEEEPPSLLPPAAAKHNERHRLTPRRGEVDSRRAVQAADGPREGLNPPAERIDITTFRPTSRTPGTRKDGAPCPCPIVPPSSTSRSSPRTGPPTSTT